MSALRIIGCILLCMSCTPTPEKPIVTATKPEKNFSVEVIESIYGGFGYRILVNHKPLIEQRNIPVVHGLHGFKTEADARCLAANVVEKIRKGEMPPSVTTLDLMNCGISLPE